MNKTRKGTYRIEEMQVYGNSYIESEETQVGNFTVFEYSEILTDQFGNIKMNPVQLN